MDQMVQNHQKSMHPSPCSETTEPISINDTPLDAPWSESVAFWILLKLVHIKWTKLVQNHQKSMQPSPCSESTEPISINDTPLDAPWSESVPFWILLKLVHIKWTKWFKTTKNRCSQAHAPKLLNRFQLMIHH